MVSGEVKEQKMLHRIRIEDDRCKCGTFTGDGRTCRVCIEEMQATIRMEKRDGRYW